MQGEITHTVDDYRDGKQQANGGRNSWKSTDQAVLLPGGN